MTAFPQKALNGKPPKRPPSYAIASDLSCVIETPDGFGNFPTKLDALNGLISRLEGERCQIADYLGRARRQRRAEIKKGQS